MLYDDWEWRDYPLINIKSDPRLFSQIIIRHARTYLDQDRITIRYNEGKTPQITLEDFGDERISPPVNLLVHYLLNQPYDQKVLEDSILYMRSCPPEERKGTFSILYNVLNPFTLS